MRRKAAARDALERSIAVFDELGASLWAQKARLELARVSGRRRSSDGLTEMERRVATLVTQGLSNKEIAAALYISGHTVSAHLTRVYRKLDVHSRTALAQRLLAGDGRSAKR